VFSTLEAPFWDDGVHPVTGNRQFGWRINNDGSLEIYTKGADRMSKWHLNLLDGLGFAGADALWISFRNKVAAFVNNNGGFANTSIQPTRWRPDWAAVKGMLISVSPITSIPCN